MVNIQGEQIMFNMVIVVEMVSIWEVIMVNTLGEQIMVKIW